jgi:predicted DNA-binding transcriptional regulator YafY
VAPDPSPTARTLRALEVLQARPGATAAELAARLGVTDRAARRYVAILREAGIDVWSERGRHGGYRLGRGTRLPPVLFTADEALALAMAVLDGHPGASAADDVVGSALGKVIRALPESVGRQAMALREHAAAAPDRSSARPDPSTTSALVDAIGSRHRVLLTYAPEGRPEWAGEVDPWAVVVRHGRWYLLCHSRRADAVRTYRIDRIRSVEQTAARFQPPADLDPVRELEENLGAGWKFDTRVRFDAPLPEVAHWIRPPMGRLEPDGDGCVLIGSTRNLTMYACEWLAGMPFDFHVEGGPELRATVAALAARLTSATGGQPVPSTTPVASKAVATTGVPVAPDGTPGR